MKAVVVNTSIENRMFSSKSGKMFSYSGDAKECDIEAVKAKISNLQKVDFMNFMLFWKAENGEDADCILDYLGLLNCNVTDFIEKHQTMEFPRWIGYVQTEDEFVIITDQDVSSFFE